MMKVVGLMTRSCVVKLIYVVHESACFWNARRKESRASITKDKS